MPTKLYGGVARTTINPLLGTRKIGMRLFGDPVQAIESATADKEDIAGVDLDQRLLRVLPAALRWNTGYRPLEDLQEFLLDAFARHVSSY